MATITIFVINPAATGSGLLAVSAGTSDITIVNDAFSGWPRSGPRSYRIVSSTTAETRVRPPNNTVPLDSMQATQASFYVYNAANGARDFRESFQGRTAGGVSTSVVASSMDSVPAQSSSRVTGVLALSDYASLSGATFVEPMISRVSGAVGDVFYVDDMFASYGETVQPYSDGNTSGWAWIGTPHNSTSTGPPL